MPSISFPALRLSPVLRRWLVPVLAAIAVMVGGVAVRAVSALARPELPARSAEQLLAGLQTARPDGLSGTVNLRADLGLPELPGLGGESGTEFNSLLSGSHTLKVWYASPSSMRVALIGQLSESSIITNGRDVWTWSSRDNAATHSVRPAPQGGDRKRGPDPGSSPMTPEQAAAMVLAALGPSTSVTTSASDRVAGRPVYELVLAPRDTDSLVAQVRIAIDAAEQVPLRVQILAKGAATPAFEVGFSSVEFARPDAQWFTFTPPPGAKVTEKPVPSSPVAALGLPALSMQGKNGVTIGSGWTTVMVARVPVGANHTGGDDLDRLLRRLPRVDSGRVLNGSLFTALLTDDGRLLVGAVSAARLQAVAADPAAQLKPAG
jgi:outer membrane lipoprotein-sorting protein